MARKALGRGLDALIPAPPAAQAGPGLREVPIEKIRPNPRQPRESFADEALEALASSLQEHGVLQPVVLRRVGEEYEIIAGERRWRAAQRAGLESIPAVIREASAQESLELALIENLQREDLNAIEVAQAYRLLVEDMGLTQEQAARRVGKDRTTVSNTLRLLKLAPQVQQLLVDGVLDMGHARALLGLEEAPAQVGLAREAVAKGWSVRQIEARVRALRSERPARRRARDPDVVAAENKLSRALGTSVTLSGKERGRIVIRYESLDELNRLYDLLVGLGRS